MQVAPLKFVSKRALTAQQQARVNGHAASVRVDGTGKLIDTSRIITTKYGDKVVHYRRVAPSPSERIRMISEVPQLFDQLQHLNVILTNACNLSCSYCYEQHTDDFGRFTPASLKEVYDFFHGVNRMDQKIFQFFGGEPLIHKQLIVSFIRTYADELSKNVTSTKLGMVTNGILLTPEFIDEYFAHDFSTMSVSIDTTDSTVDHREIGQENIQHIMQMLERIPTVPKEQHQVSIRCTISVETVDLLASFIKQMYDIGLRSIVVHPLTMSSVDGFVVWPDEKWATLRTTIEEANRNLPNLQIQFSEGVGLKGGNNCMVGSDMLAVDASGDFSGCYFFTNQKQTASHTILGNVFEDAVYVDRYMGFQDAYNAMFETEEQCQTCDVRGFCYQCPAGNLDSGDGRLFRPDAMCQSIVRLFVYLQDDIQQKAIAEKYQRIAKAVAMDGEQRVFAKAISHLMYKHITGHHIPVGEIDSIIDSLPDYRRILGYFTELINDGVKDLPCACDHLLAVDYTQYDALDVKFFYEYLLRKANLPSDVSEAMKGVEDDPLVRAFYLTMIHVVILNTKGEELVDQVRIIRV